MSADTMPITTRLKDSTQDLHDAAERHAFQRQLMGGELPRQAYTEYLAQLFLVHQRLEGHLRSGRHEAFGKVVHDYQYQEPYLAADLEFLGADLAGVSALPATQRLLEEIDRMAADAPIGLLGMHYVFEGSNNGSGFIARALREKWAMGEEGMRYLDPYGDLQRPRWQAFKDDMESLDLSSQERDSIVSSAKATFRGITHIFDDLLGKLEAAPSTSGPLAVQPA